MKRTKTSLLIFFLLTTALHAASGDRIRDVAPVTALLLDARDGNERPLLNAYFDNEIDYFLDVQGNASPIIHDLNDLRAIGLLIETGNFAEADQRLRSLQRFDKERQYLRAVMDASQGRQEQALEGFRRLIDDRSHLSKNLRSLAFMGAARVFHEIGDYKQALYHYTRIGQLDPEFFQAVFEKSWSFYSDGDMNGALGTTLTFLSPYFESAFFPEAFVVRAAAFYQLCYFDRANQTIDNLKRGYEPVRIHIQELLSRDPQSWLFDDRVLRSLNKKILGFMIADQRFRSAMRAYLELKEEAKRVPAGDRNLNAQAMAQVRSRLISDTPRVLQKALKILKDVLSQADLIQIEILQSGANQIMGVAPQKTVDVKIIDLGAVDFDPLVQFWPFKSEFWVDELGSYYYGLKSNCPDASGK